MRDWLKWKRGVKASAIVGVGLGIGTVIGFFLAGIIISLMGLISLEIPSRHWWDVAAPFALVFGPLFVGQLIDDQKGGMFSGEKDGER